MRNADRSTGEEPAVGHTAGEDPGTAAKRPSPRRWTVEEKARIVRESFRTGKRISEVARRYRVPCKRLSAWRGLARQGKLAMPPSLASGSGAVSAEPETGSAFAAVEVEDVPGSVGSVAIEAGGVTVRIGGDSSVARIAEIAAALRGL